MSVNRNNQQGILRQGRLKIWVHVEELSGTVDTLPKYSSGKFRLQASPGCSCVNPPLERKVLAGGLLFLVSGEMHPLF